MQASPLPDLPYLSELKLNAFIDAALAEDIGGGDHSTLACIPEDTRETAYIQAKSSGIIAGVVMAEWILKRYDNSFELITHREDGESVSAGDIILTLDGPARGILSTERLVLNILQRMSGIASYTWRLQQSIAHTEAKLLDTRKTTPLVRMLEKWAVYLGGGINHRFGLYDMIMLKDNHIDMAGGITQALNRVRDYKLHNHLSIDVVVETRNLDEVAEALNHPTTSRILLDNMSPILLEKAVKLIGGRLPSEASGGITEETIVAVAETGVSYISVGALTHSYQSMDISLYSGKP